MLTTSHAALTCILFHRIIKNRSELIIAIISSIIPDVEILVWFFLSLLQKYLSINIFSIDFDDLLYGSGISFFYWPWTLFTNSIITTTAVLTVLHWIARRKNRFFIICWAAIICHILIDCVSHERGNMILWPFSTKKYFGLFEFNHLSIRLIMIEQIVTISILFCFISFFKKKHAY